jgi:translation initiation factor IF-1
MVKNTTGGSKHKGMARKLVNAPVSNKIRFSEDEDECYAKVVKMLGNGMCHVNLLHKDVMHNNVVCHIRGKFRSRNKKANFVATGGTILVGLRSWTSKIDACDLLCVYNDNQLSSLNLPSSFNNDTDTDTDNRHHHDDISFDNNISNIDFKHNLHIEQHIIHQTDIDFNDI